MHTSDVKWKRHKTKWSPTNNYFTNEGYTFFRSKKGDVIDLSFQRNQLQSTKKICIKYPINKDTNKNQESKKYKKSKIKMNSNNIDKVFKGLTLVMVGMEPEESELREAVENEVENSFVLVESKGNQEGKQ